MKTPAVPPTRSRTTLPGWRLPGLSRSRRAAYSSRSAAPIIREDPRDLLSRGLKWADKIARLQSFRGQDYLLARFAELLDVLVHDAAELRHQRRSFLPLSVRRKRDRTYDCFHLIGVEILCDRLLIKRPHRLDGLLKKLAGGVTIGSKIVAQRIDLRFHGALRVSREEFFGPVEIHLRFGQPGVVVDDAVEQRTQIGHHGGELQANHAAAENLDVV